MHTCEYNNGAHTVQGVSSFVAVHDLLSGSRLHRADLRAPVVALCFTPDGTALVTVLQVSAALLCTLLCT